MVRAIRKFKNMIRYLLGFWSKTFRNIKEEVKSLQILFRAGGILIILIMLEIKITKAPRLVKEITFSSEVE